MTHVERTNQPLFTAAGMPWAVKGDKGWGWYAFRRGNATHIAANMDSSKGTLAAATMLRHSDQGQTAEAHYIKNTNQDRRALAARKKIEIDELRVSAAATMNAALTRPN